MLLSKSPQISLPFIHNVIHGFFFADQVHRESLLMRGMPPAQPNETATHRVLPIEPARRLLRRDAYPNLVRLLRKLHSSECAELLTHLTVSEQSKVFERLSDLELATAIFNASNSCHIFPQNVWLPWYVSCRWMMPRMSWGRSRLNA
jgi:hypothetical protein